MKICIHRGTKHIGESCVELESDCKRLLIDIGLPLDAELCQAAVAFPKMVNDGKSAKILQQHIKVAEAFGVEIVEIDTALNNNLSVGSHIISGV